MKKTAAILLGAFAILATVIVIGNKIRADQFREEARENAAVKASTLVALFWDTCGDHLPNFVGVDNTLLSLGFEQDGVLWVSADRLLRVDTHEQNGIMVCSVSHLGGGLSAEGLEFQSALKRELIASFSRQDVSDWASTSPNVTQSFRFVVPEGEFHLSTVDPLVTELGGLLLLSM